MKYIWFVGAVVLIGIGILMLWPAPSEQSSSGQTQEQVKKLSVVTTLFPLYDFATVIGGEYADVSLLPPGVESHAFEPKPSDMVRIDQSDIFVYTGKAMELWAEDLRTGIRPMVGVVDASQGIELKKEAAEAEGEHEAGEESAHDDHGGVDPHMWLDFDNAKKMVSTLEAAFIERDPVHADTYQRNAAGYRAQLAALDTEYRTGLASCATKRIVYGGHYAFGYLVNRYGLEYMAAQGLAPDAEPSAQDMAKLTEQIRRNGIRYVFYEELSSPKIAETLARETGAQMLLLNAAHNIGKDDYTQGTTFLGIMRENLSNLRVGLVCR